MRLFSATKTIGVTVKLVIEVEEDRAQQFLKALPSDITIGGERLLTMRVGVDGVQIEPVRVAMYLDDMSIEQEDEFLGST